MGFGETVDYLYGLQKFGTKLGLDNTRALLGLLGNPQDRMRFLHVTGTNGKGSVCALSASALVRAGHRTGLYTSPHLVSFTERIRVDGEAVSEDGVIALAERLKGLSEKNLPGLRPTFFEFTTAMALDYFAREGVEAAVLEVGMGGRLDSTNAVDPLCTVITNVDMEHMEYLGGTIEAIAHEKAGIIKPGVPLVTSEIRPQALGVIERTCREMGSRMYLLGRDFGFSRRGASLDGCRVIQTMDYAGPGGDLAGLEVPLAGAHQLVNAAVAACALGVVSGLGLEVVERAVREGFREVSWEGRIEIAALNPLLVLDGAHNPASVERLCESVREYFGGRYRRLFAVVGVLSDKDSSVMLGALSGLADTLVLTQADYDRAVPAGELFAGAPRGGAAVTVKPSVPEALAWALGEAGPEDMVLVTGSLYIVGEAKAWLSKKEQFLKA